MAPSPSKRFVTIQEYAAARSVHRRTISRWNRRGFPLIRIGGKILIDPIAGDEWITRHSVSPAPIRRPKTPSAR